MGSLKQKVVKGAFWVLLEKMTGQFAAFFVTIVLSRLLTPEDYGMVALLTVVFVICNALVDCGLGSALVQKANPTAIHFDSMFYCCIVLSLMVYAILFCVAPAIARFYEIPLLKELLRVASLNVVFSAVNSVQNAYLQRRLAFHLSFRITLITTVVSATSGITLACLGYGPWALVWQGVIGGFAGMVARWIIIGWRPRLEFSFKALGELLNFGWKMTVMNLIAVSFADIYGLLIGKWYKPETLAYVNKGKSLPLMITNSLNGMLVGVSFPALAKLQDSKERLSYGMSRMLQCSTFLIFPLMCALSVCAADTVLLVFGHQWEPAVVFMQIICIQYALTPVADINMQGMAAMGKSNYFIPMQIIKTGLSFLVLIFALRHSVMCYVLVGCGFCKALEIAVNSWPNRKLFGFPIERQICMLLPTMVCCMVMIAVMVLVKQLCFVLCGDGKDVISVVIRLFFQGTLGIMAYILAASTFARATLIEFVKIIEGLSQCRFPRIATYIRRFAQ